MNNNLFVAYDLMSPGQNYDAVRDTIRSLGVTWQFQYSLFYLRTDLAPDAVFARVFAAMDGNDRLAVIVAADAIGAIVTNWDHPPINEINAIWLAQ
jgi:hypothetical protein